MLLAGAAWSALPSAQAAAGDAGTRDYAAEDKLLGGPSSYAGYADPYGQAPNANGKGAKNAPKAGTATTSAETMMNNNADPAQTNASFVKPGTVVMKRGARVQDANGKIVATPDTAAQSVYGANGVKVARKPLEIYKSPY
ncbi:hypothetical protein PAMC26577_02815 [Caballeronia sordidicola]|uniref:Uncharacterized protein n=2 Tax=Caballeronia sordidicola TaxID=196367 RepID=A0A242N6C3_CABSO|nr:hypothetical protein PAMC26577_02815 [Caballeronia sordidicola]